MLSEEHADTRGSHPSRYVRVKRIADYIGALLLTILLFPVLSLIAAAIYFTSPGPILIRQKRLTEGGRLFTMYKFRTMVADAEKCTGAVWAEHKDTRITPIGAWLRRVHLDELPQLFNVLHGEMSLIGPRPERPEFAAMLCTKIPRFNRRTEVRAGVTGLAQITIGYSSSIRHYRHKVRLDVLYVEKCSPALDFLIAYRTLQSILAGTENHSHTRSN